MCNGNGHKKAYTASTNTFKSKNICVYLPSVENDNYSVSITSDTSISKTVKYYLK